MKPKRICVLYFSPTGGTEKIARFAAGALAAKLGLEQTFIDFTKPENRQAEYRFGADDLLVMASPVYAGRLPNKLQGQDFWKQYPRCSHLCLWQPQPR